MSAAIGLWYVQNTLLRVFQLYSHVVTLWCRSKTIEPGEPVEIELLADLRITNVALGDDIVDEKGRTTVKIIHRPMGSEGDSDDEDEDEEALAAEADAMEIETAVLCSLTYGKV